MPIDRDALHRHMTTLADDPALVVPFVEEFGDHLARNARYHLADLGRRDLAGDRAEVQGLVWDIALILHDQAAAWRPDGALPWRWAYRPIRSHVAGYIGHARSHLGVEAIDDTSVPPMASATDIDFDRNADGHPLIALVRDALVEVPGSELHRRVLLEYRIQMALGDPSPSHTVADLFGLTDTNVRQIDHRVRRKLAAVVAGNDRYQALRAIPWLEIGLAVGGDGERAA